jgi:hypothetical protein
LLVSSDRFGRISARLQQKITPPHPFRQTSPSSPPIIPRPVGIKKPVTIKNGTIDEDSAEEVIIVESPQQQQQQPSLTEQNVLKLMTTKCQEFTSQALLQSSPTSAYVPCSTKKNDEIGPTQVPVDDWSDDDDDDDDDDEHLQNTAGILHAADVARRATPFNRAG